MTAIKVLTPLTGPSHLLVKKVCWVLWSYWGAAQHSQPGWQFGIFDICELQVVKPQCSGCHVGPEGFLSFVRHTWPAGHRLHCPASSARQETPRYSTISCYAQVSVRLNINTCNGNEVTNIYLVKTLLLSPTDGCGEMYSFGLDASYLHLQGIAWYVSLECDCIDTWDWSHPSALMTDTRPVTYNISSVPKHSQRYK